LIAIVKRLEFEERRESTFLGGKKVWEEAEGGAGREEFEEVELLLREH
jgi:hypothetical protein